MADTRSGFCAVRAGNIALQRHTENDKGHRVAQGFECRVLMLMTEHAAFLLSAADQFLNVGRDCFFGAASA